MNSNDQLWRFNSLSWEFTPLILERYSITLTASHYHTPSSSSIVQQGKALSTAGPSRYQGDILDDPDMLWSDDHWDENRIKEAVARLRQDQGDTTGCSAFWREHYVHRAGTYWHEFYKRNVDHFYKDRHYLHIVFPELLGCGSDGTLRMMEVGSGVGNAIFPLLETNRNLQVFAFDFARAAIDIMKSNELYIQLNSSVNEGNFRVLGDTLFFATFVFRTCRNV